MMENNIIINQALDALKASLPVDDVAATTSISRNSVGGNDTIAKIMGVILCALSKKTQPRLH